MHEVVTLQFGQCGNQLGHNFFDSLINNTKSFEGKFLDQYFRESPTTQQLPVARSVLVDMEPKVVSQCLHNAIRGGKFVFDQSSAFCQHSGSGNNWAFGYGVCAPRVAENVLEVIRKVCDAVLAFKNNALDIGGRTMRSV